MRGELWRVYIAGLTGQTGGAELAELAAPWGNVLNAEIRVDESTGASKGFGWVDMSSRSESIAVMEHVNGLELHGRHLTATVLNTPPMVLDVGNSLPTTRYRRAGDEAPRVARSPTAKLDFKPVLPDEFKFE
jgi:hypothetical protein